MRMYALKLIHLYDIAEEFEIEIPQEKSDQTYQYQWVSNFTGRTRDGIVR